MFACPPPHPRARSLASAGVSTGTSAQVQPAHRRPSRYLPVHAARAGDTAMLPLLYTLPYCYYYYYCCCCYCYYCCFYYY